MDIDPSRSILPVLSLGVQQFITFCPEIVQFINLSKLFRTQGRHPDWFTMIQMRDEAEIPETDVSNVSPKKAVWFEAWDWTRIFLHVYFHNVFGVEYLAVQLFVSRRYSVWRWQVFENQQRGLLINPFPQIEKIPVECGISSFWGLLKLKDESANMPPFQDETAWNSMLNPPCSIVHTCSHLQDLVVPDVRCSTHGCALRRRCGRKSMGRRHSFGWKMMKDVKHLAAC